MAEKGKETEKKLKLTPRHKKFVERYIASGNATQSYKDAGYTGKGAQVSASKLLTNPIVSGFLEERRKEIAEQSDIKSQDVINEIAKIAFSNSEDFFKWDKEEVELIPGSGIKVERGVAVLKTPEELTRDHKACIQSIEETQHGIKLKLYNKQSSLESLKKYFGLDNEEDIKKAIAIKKAEGNEERGLASMTAEELIQVINACKSATDK